MAASPELANVFARSDLIGLARKRRPSTERETVKTSELEERLRQGWHVVRRNKQSVVVGRTKRHDIQLEDRVWMLLYRMRFDQLSGRGGAILTLDPDASNRLTNQIDVLGIDDEVAVAIECKSSQSRSRRGTLQEELAKHSLLRAPIARAVNISRESKRQVILAFFVHNAILSDGDRDRAREQNVVLFGDQDLTYYELLTHHLGPAAKFQFLADLVPGKQIPGLEIRVPALRSKMGGYVCYTFAVSPSYLLKVAYVSHRARGQESDITTYQRMLSRSRLRNIAQYISEPDSVFPTNIVLNLEKGRKGTRIEFARAKQQEDAQGATFGWLTLRPTYRSAWVIDGQHRLYAYSGHPLSDKSGLSVLAFEGLPGHVQQKLFIDINAEQKRVKKSLLQELYADLHRTSDDPAKRTRAYISETIQRLNSDAASSFFDRILLADSVRTDTRCISLNSLFSALDRPGMYFRSIREGVVVDPGPLWGPSEAPTIKRSSAIINGWFEAIRDSVPDWWDLGASEGGGLAMNDGVTVCVNVLRSVFEHLDRGKTRLHELAPSEALERLKPYADALGEHLSSMNAERRQEFRALRGVQGQTAGMRHAQRTVQLRIPSFKPDGLQDFLEREKAQTNAKATELIGEIERILSTTVIGTLKEQFGTENDRWWYDGVPKTVRTMVTARQEEEDNRAGSKEAYLDLIHYRSIVLSNWSLLGPLLGFGKTGNKQKKTEWLARMNEIRKIAAHASRGATVSFEQLSELEEYLSWLRATVSGVDLLEPAPREAESTTDHANTGRQPL
jgi:DGQHR domain-containing protein